MDNTVSQQCYAELIHNAIKQTAQHTHLSRSVRIRCYLANITCCCMIAENPYAAGFNLASALLTRLGCNGRGRIGIRYNDSVTIFNIITKKISPLKPTYLALLSEHIPYNKGSWDSGVPIIYVVPVA